MTTGGRLSAKSASTSPITTTTANTPDSVTSHQTNSNSPSPLQTKPSACPSNRQHLRRLDILLKNPEDDSKYEVEIMLGETDETHIIRTIEYWDNEKRKWPQRQHIAVLVAEHINRRFFNVIHLLSHSIPIVAVQVAMLNANG